MKYIYSNRKQINTCLALLQNQRMKRLQGIIWSVMHKLIFFIVVMVPWVSTYLDLSNDTF